MELPTLHNRPLHGVKNVLRKSVVHQRSGKNIPMAVVIRFIEKRFDTYKFSTSYMDIVRHFDITKPHAQRILKIGLTRKLLIAPRSKKPQEYYPNSRHFDVTDYINKKNVPVDTTGTSPFKSPLSLAIEQQKASNFLQSLLFARYVSRQIHKLQLEFTIDKKKLLDRDYYDTISSKMWKQNKGKFIEDFIDGRKVIFTYYKNCTVVIWVTCNENPFDIEKEDDISVLNSFLGQVRDRVEYQLSDPRGRLVPHITHWTLKQCDLNKDVPVTDEAQISLPDIQVKTALGVFRLYVKNLRGQAHYRIEDSRVVNDSIRFLAGLINPDEELKKILGVIAAKLDALVNVKSQMDSGIDETEEIDTGASAVLPTNEGEIG